MHAERTKFQRNETTCNFLKACSVLKQAFFVACSNYIQYNRNTPVMGVYVGVVKSIAKKAPPNKIKMS